MARIPVDAAALWTFHDALHPVYTRPENDDRWPLPIAGTTAQPYLESPTGIVSEDLRLDVEGAPSMSIYQETGTTDTVIALWRRTRFMETMQPEDREAVERLARDMMQFCVALSQGPYTPGDLRRMGHPYGWQKSWAKGDAYHVPIRVPRYDQGRSLGHRRGVRGSVPTMSVVNRDTGAFAQSWNLHVLWDPGGVRIEIRNTRHAANGAPVAWFLAHGTIYMQPHGPWQYVLRRFSRQLRAAWARATIKAAARHRALAAVVGDEVASMMETPNG